MRMALAAIALLVATSCATTTSNDRSLYEALGGKQSIERIAGRLVAKIGEDERIRPFFLHTNLERFHTLFTAHLCQLAGGPCEYTGDSMVDVHVGMDISEAEFNRVVEILVEAMAAEGIPHTVQNRLLARLAPLRDEVILR